MLFSRCAVGVSAHGVDLATRSLERARVPLAAGMDDAATIKPALADAFDGLQVATSDATKRAPDAATHAHLRAATRDVLRAHTLLGTLPIHCIDGLVVRAQGALEQARAGYAKVDFDRMPHDLDSCPKFSGVLPTARDTLLEDRAVAHAAAAALERPAAATPPRPDVDPKALLANAATPAQRHDAVATGRAARDELAAAFAPVVDDLAAATRALRDAPLAGLPRHGSAPATDPKPRNALLGLDLAKFGLADTSGMRALPSVRSEARVAGEYDIAFHPRALVGDYGAPLATALVDAARIMNAAALRRTESLDGQALRFANRGALDTWTFRRDLSRTVVEGINSYAVAFGMLASRRIEGLDAAGAIAAIAESGLVDRLAKAPAAVLGPLNLNQLAPKLPVQVGANGRLELGDDFAALLRGVRAHQERHGTTSPSTSAGCPIGVRGLPMTDAPGGVNDETGIATLEREYVALVQRLLIR